MGGPQPSLEHQGELSVGGACAKSSGLGWELGAGRRSDPGRGSGMGAKHCPGGLGAARSLLLELDSQSSEQRAGGGRCFKGSSAERKLGGRSTGGPELRKGCPTCPEERMPRTRARMWQGSRLTAPTSQMRKLRLPMAPAHFGCLVMVLAFG